VNVSPYVRKRAQQKLPKGQNVPSAFDASGAVSIPKGDFLVLLRGFLGFSGAGVLADSVRTLGGGGLADPDDSSAGAGVGVLSCLRSEVDLDDQSRENIF
jgi:hypothetical protein